MGGQAQRLACCPMPSGAFGCILLPRVEMYYAFCAFVNIYLKQCAFDAVKLPKGGMHGALSSLIFLPGAQLHVYQCGRLALRLTMCQPVRSHCCRCWAVGFAGLAMAARRHAWRSASGVARCCGAGGGVARCCGASGARCCAWRAVRCCFHALIMRHSCAFQTMQKMHNKDTPRCMCNAPRGIKGTPRGTPP